jgi:hypothetical protein
MPTPCSITGEDKCAFLLSGEHREHALRLEQLVGELKEVGRSLRDLVAQERESRAEEKGSRENYLESLQGKTPKGYVPMSTHVLMIVIALGIQMLPRTLEMIEKAIGH